MMESEIKVYRDILDDIISNVTKADEKLCTEQYASFPEHDNVTESVLRIIGQLELHRTRLIQQLLRNL